MYVTYSNFFVMLTHSNDDLVNMTHGTFSLCDGSSLLDPENVFVTLRSLDNSYFTPNLVIHRKYVILPSKKIYLSGNLFY